MERLFDVGDVGGGRTSGARGHDRRGSLPSPPRPPRRAAHRERGVPCERAPSSSSTRARRGSGRERSSARSARGSGSDAAGESGAHEPRKVILRPPPARDIVAAYGTAPRPLAREAQAVQQPRAGRLVQHQPELPFHQFGDHFERPEREREVELPGTILDNEPPQPLLSARRDGGRPSPPLARRQGSIALPSIAAHPLGHGAAMHAPAAIHHGDVALAVVHPPYPQPSQLLQRAVVQPPRIPSPIPGAIARRCD